MLNKLRTITLLTFIMLIFFSTINVLASSNLGWNRETDMLESGYTNGNAFVSGNKLYVVYSNSTITKVNIYDTITKTWSSGSSINIASGEFTASKYGENIYVVAGSPTGNTKANLAIYNITTNTWKLGTPRNDQYSNYGISSSAAVNGKLYVFGGGYKFSSINTTYIYDISTDSWSSGPSMPNARRENRAIVYKDKIYLVSGTTNHPTTLKNMDIYDTLTGRWETNNSIIPAGSLLSSLEIIDGKLYLIGGVLGEPNQISNKIYEYDFTTNSWSISEIELSSYIGFHSSAYIDNKLYIIGGKDSSGNYRLTTESYILNEKLSVLLDINEEVFLSNSHNLEDNKDYIWTSSNPNIASVNESGKVTALSEGTTYIYCKNSSGTYNDYIPVKVIKGAEEIRLSVHLKKDESRRLWLNDDVKNITWSIEYGQDFCSIDSSGRVKGLSQGLSIVKAEYAGKSYYIYVRVNEN